MSQNKKKMEPSLEGKKTAAGDVLGRIHLAPEVLEVIIGIATNEVQGVAMTQGNLATDVAEKFGKTVHGKGIKVNWDADGLAIDIYCIVEFGYNVPEVAKEVQEQVRQSIFHMTSLETKEVNVFITGIQFEEQKA